MHFYDKCFHKYLNMKYITISLTIWWTLWFSHIFSLSAWLIRIPNVVTSDTNTKASKEILVEPQLFENLQNVLEETKNESVVLHQQSTFANSVENATHEIDSPTESIQMEMNKTEPVDETTIIEQNELNLTVEENQIPVFSEWAQKRLEEVEKEVEQETVNSSTMKKNAQIASKTPVLKLKNSKNYASPDCGAKIIAANSESSGTGYVLTKTRDEYMLSPCKSRIWFVVELCEAIQAERIDLANFELFSSSPKNFSVGVSSRFPTRDWRNVGKFIAKDERYIQNFDLYPHLFGKYVRVDIHSHYNSEHFCPISLFRVYGTSEFEAFETENRQHPIEDIDDDDEDDQEIDASKSKTNFLKTAGEAVMSIVDSVKKAASFGKPNENKTVSDSPEALKSDLTNENCITTNHAISCENCSDDTLREVTRLLECKHQQLERILSIDLIRNSLYKSRICNTLIGSDININCNDIVDMNSKNSKQLTDSTVDYITHSFTLEYIAAMCNLLAAGGQKTMWNSTIQITTETPINVTIVKTTDDQLQPSDVTKPKPSVQIASSIQTENDVESTSQENSVDTESQSQTEQQVNILPDSIEYNQEPDMHDKSSNIIDGNKVETTLKSPNIESNEMIDDKSDQNIFNVVDSADTSGEKQASQIPEIQTIEPNNQPGFESETPPPVIILPEMITTPLPPTTTTATATATTTTNDLNDSSEEQAQNGWTNTPQFGQKLHSESVFLRLSNRVKALERNMSLSGQYLEELSRRYKKQVEELQTTFAKTLINIEEQSKKSLERKQELFEQNQQLRNELDILNKRIFSWRNILICCGCFTCVQIIIFHLILKIWGRKYGLVHNEPSSTLSDTSNVEQIGKKRKTGNVPMKFRRKSAEEKRERNPSESSSCALQRRPSTEALNITGTYTELLIDDTNASGQDCHYNKSSSCNSHETDISGYVKIEDLKELYDKPTEEYEFHGPTSELKTNGSECSSETTIDSSIDSAPTPPPSQQQQKKSKAFKNKYKNPFSSGSVAQSTGWEWHRSKKLQNSSQINHIKKSKSESPPSIKPNGINNNNSVSIIKQRKSLDHVESVRTLNASSIDERKASGSFKRILKKIF